MSADFNTTISMRGNGVELFDLLKAVKKYVDHEDPEDDYLLFANVKKTNGDELSLNGATDEAILSFISGNEMELCVTAGGPYGEFVELLETDFYESLAEAAPKASFSALTDGFTTGEDERLQAELAGGKLHLVQNRISNDFRCDNLAEALELLPLDTFRSLFHVDPDECDEFLYEEYMEKALYDEEFPDVDYSAFLELFPFVHIDEEEYPQAIDAVKKTGLGSAPEGLIDEMTYDPLSKEYEDISSNYSLEEENAYESCEGKTFVITGKLEYFDNRDEMTEYIEDDGGRVTDGVSSKTDFLICNDPTSASSKMKKAKELGIPVLTEEEFLRRFSDDPEAFGIEIE